MGIVKFSMWLMSVASVFGAAAGLTSLFGLVDLPAAMAQVWTHIPSLGSGMLGQICCLGFAALVSSGLYATSPLPEPGGRPR